ncbi:MAG: A/G-specific adenine glycosylase [Phycisphaerales bacterium]|nr:A/G-specific adenine glycosylase [Phycisphaerales bacterium]
MPARPPLSSLPRTLTRWFLTSARELPWRTNLNAPADHRRDPYRTLVSELMLQQTQVSRVIDKFNDFLTAFPTPASLAAAPESRILALWSGLGYYRRAKLLYAAAKAILRDHDGRIPDTVEELLTLPGIGPYTAGAIASLAYGKPVPIVDGNIARVLFRIHGRDATHADPRDMKWAWDQAAQLVNSAAHAKVAVGGVGVGDLNEALMELGATICTPTSPRCNCCPIRSHCIANATARQHQIPRPKRPITRRELFCDTVLARSPDDKLLIEHRPSTGMWANLWQAPTLEDPTAAKPATRCRLEHWLNLKPLTLIERFTHQTTHRTVHFTIWKAARPTPTSAHQSPTRQWATREQISELALSNPQRRILLELSR